MQFGSKLVFDLLRSLLGLPWIDMTDLDGEGPAIERPGEPWRIEQLAYKEVAIVKYPSLIATLHKQPNAYHAMKLRPLCEISEAARQFSSR